MKPAIAWNHAGDFALVDQDDIHSGAMVTVKFLGNTRLLNPSEKLELVRDICQEGLRPPPVVLEGDTIGEKPQ